MRSHAPNAEPAPRIPRFPCEIGSPTWHASCIYVTALRGALRPRGEVVMRYLFGFLCVCALGLMPLVGCSETGGTRVTCEGNVCPCGEAGIRAAIEAGGNDPYTFNCDGPQTVMTTAEIIIDNNVILDGEGALTVDGNEDHRVFSVPGGVTAELRGFTVSGGFAADGGGVFNDGTLTMVDVNVSRNAASEGPPPTRGAGVFNAGTLTVMNSVVERNTEAWLGGGIWNAGVLMMTNSTVSENEGGGILNIDIATMTLTDSIVSANTASRGGGVSNDGTMTLTNCTVEGNIAEGGSGGGIVNEALGVLTLTNSTVRDNRAEALEGDEFGPIWGRGGGIDNGNVLTLVNSTVSGNTAVEAGGIAHGSDGGSMTLSNSTISGNLATGCEGISEEPDCGVGGIWNGGPATLTNCTVSGNAGDFAGSIYNEGDLTLMSTLIDRECGGPADITSDGYNIESPGDTCGFDQQGDQPSVTEEELNLGPLADNGGPTLTHKPGASQLWVGSVAIDQIPTVDCGATTDQRGQPRPETDGIMCDVGSVEVQPENL
jgi:hypothetical protein